MQLRLKRKGEYSVRAMVHVARHGDGLRRAREISSEMQIPYKFLTQILANLVAKGFLEAKAGPAGGYSLARLPGDITLLEVIEAAEGPITFEYCVLVDGPCDRDDTCPVHDTWSRAQRGLVQELSSTTLAHLAGTDAAIPASTHEPQNPPGPRRIEGHGQRN